MKIEPYHIDYAKELAQLYTNTVHNINIKDYTQEQIESWHPLKLIMINGKIDLKQHNPIWLKRTIQS